MTRFVNISSTGKTKQTLTEAKMQNYVVVCASPARMRQKSEAYGLGYVECISYEDFFERYKENTLEPKGYMIDELEKFVSFMFIGGALLKGYNMTVE